MVLRVMPFERLPESFRHSLRRKKSSKKMRRMLEGLERSRPKTSECPAAGAGFFASARAQPTVGGQGF